MTRNCIRCGKQTDPERLSSYVECPACTRLRHNEEDEALRRRSMNMALGDFLNTGIPGGIDFDPATLL